MTSEQIDELVATKIMGFPSFHEEGISQKEFESRQKQIFPEYSHDISEAMKLLPRPKFFGYTIDYRQKGLSNWPEAFRCKLVSSNKFSEEGTVIAYGDSAAMAICKAALKSIGIEV